MMELKSKKQRAPEVNLLIGQFRKLAPGDSITIASLSKEVKFDVASQSGLRWAGKAREILRQDHLGVIKKEGASFRRDLDTETVQTTAPTFLRKARRAAHRSSESLMCTDYDALNEHDKLKHNVQLGMSAAIRIATSQQAKKKLGEAVKKTQAALPDSETLKLFSKIG